MTCPTGDEGRIGWIIGESSPDRSIVLFDKGAKPRTGMYLLVGTDQGCVLGVLERVYTGNLVIGDKVRDSEELRALTSYPDLRDRTYWYGAVQWLTLLEPLLDPKTRRPVSPGVPPEPGQEVYRAPASVLSIAFQGTGPEWVKLGSLVSDPSVEFSVNVNKLGRHLAILAVTGGGKSNTVCVLSHRIVSRLGGTMVVFDMHGEYANASGIAPGRTAVKQPKINPFALSFPELRRLARIPENAHVQERILREAWKEMMKDYRNGQLVISQSEGFLGKLAWYAERRSNSAKDNPKSLAGLLNRLDDIADYYGSVLDLGAPRNLTDYIEPGKLNIIDLSDVDEFGADAVVSHYLRRLLEARKRWKTGSDGERYPVPVITIIEEAHVLIPRDQDTLTRYWAGRVAREGRKFGVGLVLVSQRPKNVDQDVLSQTNNKIILRIVEPQDQRYVQAASEQLSEDLMRLLPGLNPGEAIVIGGMTRLPALVKIDLCPARTGGTDVDFVGAWSSYRPGPTDERVLDELEGL